MWWCNLSLSIVPQSAVPISFKKIEIAMVLSLFASGSMSGTAASF
jgi:hypothetical protein